MVLTVFSGMADPERRLIVERTSTGRAAAKARGRRFGRKLTLAPAQPTPIDARVDEGKAGRQAIAQRFSIDRSTFYRVLPQRTSGAT